MPWGDGHQARLGKSGWQRQADNRRILARDGRRCQLRLPNICTVIATEVDHRVPLVITGPTGDVDSNKQAACAPCHRAKTAREQAAGKAKKSRRRPPEQHPGLLAARRGGV